MLIDGPADDLDFDDEEFIGGLSYHNRMFRLKISLNVSNFSSYFAGTSSLILVVATRLFKS